MNSRERVLKTVAHQQTDRVPVCYTARNDVTRRFMSFLGITTHDELQRKLGLDFRYVSIREHHPDFEDKIRQSKHNLPGTSNRYLYHEDRKYEDAWGVIYRTGRDGLYTEWVSGPFSESDDLDSYDWPSLDIYEEVETIKERILAYNNEYAVQGGISLPFKKCWALRGLENFMCDMAGDPIFAGELLKRVAYYEKEKGLRLVKAGVDIIGITGDIGMQDRMLVSPKLWRSIEKPVIAEMIDTFKQINPQILVYFHSDGNIMEVIPDLIDIGVNIINPIQPECMDPVEVKRKFGDRITMHGTISIQKTLPTGTAADVRCEVKERIKTCGQDGGLIISPSNLIQNDTPMENILAIYEAAGSLAI